MQWSFKIYIKMQKKSNPFKSIQCECAYSEFTKYLNDNILLYYTLCISSNAGMC
jgi:hypothetical protein